MAHGDEEDGGETVVGKGITLKHMGISRYLEIQYMFKDIKGLSFEDAIR